jgi:putative hemolysin
MDSFLLEFLVIFLLIVLAGLLSASEIAIGSFGSGKIDEMKEKRDKYASAFQKIQNDPDSFFGTVQLTLNLLLVVAAVIAAHLSLEIVAPRLDTASDNGVDPLYKAISVIIAVAIVAFLTMIFAILIPKSLGFKYSEEIGKVMVMPLLLLTFIFRYPVKLITYISNLLLKPFKESTNFYQTRLSEDEIRMVLSESVKSGTIDEAEQEIIENIFEFNEMRVNEVMIPRTEMVAVEMVENIAEVTDDILKAGHSLIPVYKDSVDNIVGVLHTKDLMKMLLYGKKPELKSVIRPAYFIPESKYISETLKEMQKRGERLAIVTDEYGGTEGVITMEDILEELIGEMSGGSQETKDYNRLPNGKYHILGTMTIYDFNELFNYELPESDEYNTVAGFVAFKSGQILSVGETVEHDGLRFELVKKIRQKMVQFIVASDNGELKESE